MMVQFNKFTIILSFLFNIVVVSPAILLSSKPHPSIKCYEGHYRPRGTCHIYDAIVLPNSAIQTDTIEQDRFSDSVFEIWKHKQYTPPLKEQQCVPIHGPVIAFTFYYH